MPVNHFHTIAHFLHLAPEVQRDLAVRFDLLDPENRDRHQPNMWLLRAKETGKLWDLGEAVQLAPQ